MSKRVIEHIASIMQAARVCRERSEQPLGGNAERWNRRHTGALCALLDEVLPSGGGFDDGVSMDHETSHEATQLVFECPFHVMNDAGYYVGWATYRVVATPSFIGGFDLAIEQISSCDEDAEIGLEDHVAEVMHDVLSAEFDIPSHYYAEA